MGCARVRAVPLPVIGSWRRRLLAGVAFLSLVGCGTLVPQTMALRDGWPPDLPRHVELAGVPFFPQEANQCGPAALATALAYSGAEVSAESLSDAVFVPGRDGSLQLEMLAAGRRYGRVAYQLQPSMRDLLREVASNNPVVVLQSIGIAFSQAWHYAVVVGYDYDRGDIYLRSGTQERLVLPFTVFEVTWKRSQYWAFVLPRPETVPVTAQEEKFVAAALAMGRVANSVAAEVTYRSLVKRWPSNVIGNLLLAETEYGLGHLEGAADVLTAALQLMPDDPALLNNLAQTLSDLGRNEQAMQVVLRINEQLVAPPVLRLAIAETRAGIYKRLLLNG